MSHSEDPKSPNKEAFDKTAPDGAKPGSGGWMGPVFGALGAAVALGLALVLNRGGPRPPGA